MVNNYGDLVTLMRQLQLKSISLVFVLHKCGLNLIEITFYLLIYLLIVISIKCWNIKRLTLSDSIWNQFSHEIFKKNSFRISFDDSLIWVLITQLVYVLIFNVRNLKKKNNFLLWFILKSITMIKNIFNVTFRWECQSRFTFFGWIF